MALLPQFVSVSTLSKAQTAVDQNIISCPAVIFIRSNKHLAFIDNDNSLHEIVGNNLEQVVKVEEMPSVADAKENVLYIYKGIVYVFDGKEFNPMYQDVSEELKNLETRITDLEKLPVIDMDASSENGSVNVLYVNKDAGEISVWNADTESYDIVSNNIKPISQADIESLFQ